MFKKFFENDEKWNKIIVSLGDYNFYSLFEWGELKRKKNWNVLRLVYYKKEKISFACQILHKKKFFVNLFWIPGGPVGSLKDFVETIYNELASNYGNLLIIKFNSSLLINKNNVFFLKKNNWKNDFKKNTFNTRMEIKLIESIEIVKSNLSKNWRHNLNRSYKHNLHLREFDMTMLNEILKVYRSMEKLKKIKNTYDLKDLTDIFVSLNKNLYTVICVDSDNKILSFRTIIYFKDKAWDLLAATSHKGRKNYSSYLTTWEIIKFCHKKNINIYDLTRVDKKNNIGVYNFKKGIGSDLVNCLGQWRLCNNKIINYMLFFYFSIYNFLNND